MQGTTTGVITDVSNAPYNNMEFKEINDVGKQWIRKYGMALSKELLGMANEKLAIINGAYERIVKAHKMKAGTEI